jgi:hypothetical protein
MAGWRAGPGRPAWIGAVRIRPGPGCFTGGLPLGRLGGPGQHARSGPCPDVGVADLFFAGGAADLLMDLAAAGVLALGQGELIFEQRDDVGAQAAEPGGSSSTSASTAATAEGRDPGRQELVSAAHVAELSRALVRQG